MQESNKFKGIINIGNGKYSYDITFGYDNEASKKYDKSIDRYAPPQPPPSFFDAALFYDGERYYSKIVSPKDLNLYLILQYGKEKNIVFEWDNTNWKKNLKTCKLLDLGNGSLGVDVDMLDKNKYEINDITICQLKLIIETKN